MTEQFWFIPYNNDWGWYQCTLCRKRPLYYKSLSYVNWSLYYMGLMYYFLWVFFMYEIPYIIWVFFMYYFLWVFFMYEVPYIIWVFFMYMYYYGSILCTCTLIIVGLTLVHWDFGHIREVLGFFFLFEWIWNIFASVVH